MGLKLGRLLDATVPVICEPGPTNEESWTDWPKLFFPSPVTKTGVVPEGGEKVRVYCPLELAVV